MAKKATKATAAPAKVAAQKVDAKDAIIAALKDTVAEQGAQLNSVCAKVRGMSDNWKKFAENHLGTEANDGKIGRVALPVLLVLCGIVVIGALAANINNLPFPNGGGWAVSDTAGVGAATIKGGEGDDAEIVIAADQGDDTADTWTLESEATGNDLSIMNGTTEVLNLTSAGNLQVDGSITAGSLRDVSLASAQTATNGAPILLEGLIVQLNSTGGTNLATNTITLTGLGTGTNGVFFIINTGTSNHLAIAQSGTWKSAAVDIGESEALVVVGNASAFYGVE